MKATTLSDEKSNKNCHSIPISGDNFPVVICQRYHFLFRQLCNLNMRHSHHSQQVFLVVSVSRNRCQTFQSISYVKVGAKIMMV